MIDECPICKKEKDVWRGAPPYCEGHKKTKDDLISEQITNPERRSLIEEFAKGFHEQFYEAIVKLNSEENSSEQ